MKQIKNIGTNIVIGLAIGLSLGFYMGRSQNKSEDVEYVQEKPITGTVSIPDPVIKTTYDFKKDIIPQLPEYVFYDIVKTVTKDSLVYQEIDSLAVLSAYLQLQTYDYVLFDNDNGKLSLKQTVQYNRLTNTNYDFRPISKHKRIKQVWTPYVGVTYNTLEFVGIRAGMFYHNIGLDYSFNKNIGNFTYENNQYHQFGVNYKF